MTYFFTVLSIVYYRTEIAFLTKSEPVLLYKIFYVYSKHPQLSLIPLYLYTYTHVFLLIQNNNF